MAEAAVMAAKRKTPARIIIFFFVIPRIPFWGKGLGGGASSPPNTGAAVYGPTTDRRFRSFRCKPMSPTRPTVNKTIVDGSGIGS